MKNKHIITILALLVVAALIGWRLVSNKMKIDEKKKPKIETEIAIPVTVATIKKEMFEDELNKIGILIPNRQADITSVVPGKLTAINFKLGSYVSQGAAIAQIDNRQQKISLEQATISKNKYDKDFVRFKNLLEGEAATEANFQDVQLQRDNATIQIELLKKQIADATIQAPISGQVVSKMKEPGEFINSGVPLGTIVDISVLKANVMVNEIDAYGMKVGDKVSLSTSIYPGVSLLGTITFISNQGDATHNYPIEITLKNSKSYPLKAGTTVNVNFNKRSGGMMMTVPRTAFVDGIKDPKVYVVEDGMAKLRALVTGQEVGNSVEIISGLNEGDHVVTNGLINIKDGSKVRIVENTAQ
ncbi:MAG TPA: efflux RND transporter periplasmic adaptor subunit [Edaphocola sp.]|nr:efflux RND transporter periplasmic adaptor subunit [Edaphocola sp.]